jgi:hypothetical protein
MSVRRSVCGLGIRLALGALLVAVAAPREAAAQPIRDVNVINTPNVNATVTNSAANPGPTRDADTTGRQPVMGASSVPFPDGQGALSGSLVLTGPTFTLLPQVPAGKRLVAQFLALTVDVPAGQQVQLSVVSKLGAASMGQPIALSAPQTIAGTDSYRTSQPILVYVGAGETVDYFVERLPSTGVGRIVVTMTGSLIDVP